MKYINGGHYINKVNNLKVTSPSFVLDCVSFHIYMHQLSDSIFHYSGSTYAIQSHVNSWKFIKRTIVIVEYHERGNIEYLLKCRCRKIIDLFTKDWS